MSSTARRFFNLLTFLSALAALWSAALWLTGGFRLQFGVLRIISSRVTRLPLALSLALVSGLLAWAISMTGERRAVVRGAPRGRRLRFALLVGSMTVGLNVLLLIAPPPPPTLNACAFIRELAWGRHLLNCDSPGFLALAQKPALILAPHETRQSRPLSPALAYAVAAPLRLVPWIAEADVTRPFAAEFVAYALINVTILVLGMSCLTWLLESGGTAAPPGIEWLFTTVALSTNDLTKLFMWSPHVQIFNLFVPCLTLYLTCRLIERGQPLSMRQGALLGLGLGVGFLAYGSFLIPVLSVAAIEAVVFRKVLGAALLVAVSCVPYACWVLCVHLVTGAFYSHEVDAYRQFVWIGDCLKLGVAACVPIASGNAWAFINTASPIVCPPLVAIFCCRVARYMLPRPVDAVADPERSVGVAIAVTFVVTAAFLGLMGFYVPRLCWMLIPPLLLTLAFELRAVRMSLQQPDGWPFKTLLLAVSAIYITILASRQGPYT